MLASLPGSADDLLPSHVILAQLELAPFRCSFQLMALPDSCVGAGYAVTGRAGLTHLALTPHVFVASRCGSWS